MAKIVGNHVVVYPVKFFCSVIDGGSPVGHDLLWSVLCHCIITWGLLYPWPAISAEVPKIDPTWNPFFKKRWPWNVTEIPKFSQNLLFFSQLFQKRYPMRDWFFYFSIFATLPGTHEGEKKVPWPAENPRNPFCPNTHGVHILTLKSKLKA